MRTWGRLLERAGLEAKRRMPGADAARRELARPARVGADVSGRDEPSASGTRAGGDAAAAWLEDLRLGRPIIARAVAVVAHPDDETVGFGLRLAGFADLTLVHVTDGAPEDMGDARRAGCSTREAYARVRTEELDAGLAELGAAPRRIALGVHDQTAVFRLPWLVGALRELLAGAALVLTHAYEGGHPDHDACAFAVQLACELLAADGGAAPARLEFAAYHKARSGRTAFGFWPDPAAPAVSPEARPDEVARKARALARHRSQRRITAWFDPAFESYRAAPRYDLARPPPPGAAVYDDWGWTITSARWGEAAREALAGLAAGAP
jgi:LmbE family N-acetylglucosaminyl deacetylase